MKHALCNRTLPSKGSGQDEQTEQHTAPLGIENHRGPPLNRDIFAFRNDKYSTPFRLLARLDTAQLIYCRKSRLSVVIRRLQCAGVNRHEAEEEESLRERTSEPRGPEFCTGIAR